MSINVSNQNVDYFYSDWYDLNMDRYKQLSTMVATTLTYALDAEHIQYVAVPHRFKQKNSFLKKLLQDNVQPQQMTDLAALRVVTLLDQDIEQVCQLIRKMFTVIDEKQIEYHIPQQDDEQAVQANYPSIHFICELGETRTILPEYAMYKGLRFEIQVKTSLEHTYAEIEHGLVAHLGKRLPSHLKYRMKRLAQTLAQADLELNDIYQQINNYQKMMKNVRPTNELTVQKVVKLVKQ
ncbi:GTP pyrophosphokinase [Acinetobacter qingfengensis]|uniref:RelA/SpoT domain-containing protein n=1 Tax=Acinetobacter qingfengensis TaxID=1262585 RepID=A0A1E7R3E7_9GAMM|nr:RelA/SpoT domain-containing protein [Acinetobacter qingfengensis]OEY93845.1 hypothetical protein BJI46_13950 [Acinetobacter qingfengensis]